MRRLEKEPCRSLGEECFPHKDSLPTDRLGSAPPAYVMLESFLGTAAVRGGGET